MYAAKALGRADVSITLLDQRNFHLFQPLLYQVATGELSPGDVAFPLRAVLSNQRNTRVLLARAVDLDPSARRVILKDGSFLEYDSLIVATGAKNHYFGNDHWSEFAPGLKSLEDATRMRHRILYAFEAAEKEPDPDKRRAWLTFVVVGAGPTGVELAGALGEIANDTLKGDFRAIRPEEARILLLDGSPRVLTPFDPELSVKAEESLIRLGVRTLLNVKVTGVDSYGVTCTGRPRRAIHRGPHGSLGCRSNCRRLHKNPVTTYPSPPRSRRACHGRRALQCTRTSGDLCDWRCVDT